jgi:hypothetical protein
MTEFTVKLTESAEATRKVLQEAAKASLAQRKRKKKSKASRQEGLYKQVAKTLSYLVNPKHPGLQTHEFDSLENPFDNKAKVFEAYAQNKTPGAYRVFWCYGPGAGEITVIAITAHP